MRKDTRHVAFDVDAQRISVAVGRRGDRHDLLAGEGKSSDLQLPRHDRPPAVEGLGLTHHQEGPAPHSALPQRSGIVDWSRVPHRALS